VRSPWSLPSPHDGVAISGAGGAVKWPPVRRRVLNLLTVLSLLLCAVLCCTLIQTWSKPATILTSYILDVTAYAGHMSIGGQTDTPGDVYFRFLGIEYVRSHHTYSPMWDMSAPLWPLVLVTALLPASRWWRWRKSIRRQATGGCHACGYNLTGNVSGTCPECGSRAAATAA
jgi:hypothetical protein